MENVNGFVSVVRRHITSSYEVTVPDLGAEERRRRLAEDLRREAAEEVRLAAERYGDHPYLLGDGSITRRLVKRIRTSRHYTTRFAVVRP
jgi:hypothetical protein